MSAEFATNNVECDLWQQMCEGSQDVSEVPKAADEDSKHEEVLWATDRILIYYKPES